MKKEKDKIIDENKIEREAIAPVIISASRSTDIPAFYSDWLVNRVKTGYLKWKNPFNGDYHYVSFNNTRLFVFWSKNPKPLIERLNFFDDNNYNYYFQYTLNHYDNLNIENNLPPVDERIDTFIKLSEKIGKEKIIWRFDPLLISLQLPIDDLVERVKYVGDRLFKHTNRMIFSFIDIQEYRKVYNNLKGTNINEFRKEEILKFCSTLSELNKAWKLKLSTCCESISLEEYNIEHSRCIDDRLIIDLFKTDNLLMNYIGYDNTPTAFPVESYRDDKAYNKIKDKGQRQYCGCIKSKDIGQYNTCPHGCIYCYANTSHEIALKNYKISKQNLYGETII